MQFRIIGIGKIIIFPNNIANCSHFISDYVSRCENDFIETTSLLNYIRHLHINDLVNKRNFLSQTLSDGLCSQSREKVKNKQVSHKLIYHFRDIFIFKIFSGIAELLCFGSSIHQLFLAKSNCYSYKEFPNRHLALNHVKSKLE